MSISSKQLDHLANLAYLNIHPQASANIITDINAMMDFVDELRLVDTTNVLPLMHPISLHQSLRPDIAQECELGHSLGMIAPQFEDNLYLVPKVIK